MGRSDHWGSCTPGDLNDRCPVGPYKDNTPGTFGDVEVLEPCNYASNVAYFRAATRMCDDEEWSMDDEEANAFKQGFLALAVGSSFWHASHTYVGYSFDNNMIALLAALMHDISVSPLKSNSTILKHLTRTPQSEKPIDVTQKIIKMFSEKDVSQWSKQLDTFNLPHDYEITYVAYINQVFFLLMPHLLAYNIAYAFSYTVLNNE